MRSIINAILDIASTGCRWRQLPKEFPPCSTAQGCFHGWSRDGTFSAINHTLAMAAREKAGREASPAAGVIDSQSVETTDSAGPRGFSAGTRRARATNPLGKHGGNRDLRNSYALCYSCPGPGLTLEYCVSGSFLFSSEAGYHT